MTKSIITFVLGAGLLSVAFQAGFLTEQKKFERVRVAIREKQSTVEASLKSYRVSPDQLNLLLVAYKDSDQLDVYAKNVRDTAYQKILSYEICARSGKLGPKKHEGDEQVPEGFYHIDRFNPTSSFYLSLGINYPNLSDKRKNNTANPGGNIFIHGSCVTIGCLPMTDSSIKEIYLLAVYARNSGQSKIPVYIFPFKMTDQDMEAYKVRYQADKELISFWNNLKIGYDKFINDQKELTVKVAKNGNYLF